MSKGVLIILFVLAPCLARPVAGEEATNHKCSPRFPLVAPWLGADAAYSVPLPDGRSVWIFGDTLYGEKRVVTHKVPRMVRNSIGVSSCSQGNWNIEYVIRKDSQGSMRDFFRAQRPQTWYWALDGFVHGNALWVTLLCLRPSSTPRPDGLDFETCGADLAKVTGLKDDPQQWKVEYLPLVSDGVAAYPSATAVVSGDYVYLFALYEKGQRPVVLTRIPLGGLDDPAKNLQYYTRAGIWKAGFDPADAKAMITPGVSEMSVRYHEGLKRWLAIYKSPDLSSGEVMAATSLEITGPWSASKVIYHIPEMQPSSPGFDKNTFCYAAKEHVQFRDEGSILFTYVCNTGDIPSLASRSDIYFPKAVRVPLTKISAP